MATPGQVSFVTSAFITGRFFIVYMWMARSNQNIASKNTPANTCIFGASHLYLKQESTLPCIPNSKTELLPAQLAGANGSNRAQVYYWSGLRKRQWKTKRQRDQPPDQP